MNHNNFWILPCYLLTSCWVVYREDGTEILVEMSHGNIIYMQGKLTLNELAWFKNNVSQPNNNQNPII